MCPLYVAGLIGPGERKSLQPIAARVAPVDYDQLHHFVAASPWDEGPLEAELWPRPTGWSAGLTPFW
jgi:SRSO17 transposase